MQKHLNFPSVSAVNPDVYGAVPVSVPVNQGPLLEFSGFPSPFVQKIKKLCGAIPQKRFFQVLALVEQRKVKKGSALQKQGKEEKIPLPQVQEKQVLFFNKAQFPFGAFRQGKGRGKSGEKMHFLFFPKVALKADDSPVGIVGKENAGLLVNLPEHTFFGRFVFFKMSAQPYIFFIVSVVLLLCAAEHQQFSPALNVA